MWLIDMEFICIISKLLCMVVHYRCWLSVKNGLIWSFVGPALCIITASGLAKASCILCFKRTSNILTNMSGFCFWQNAALDLIMLRHELWWFKTNVDPKSTINLGDKSPNTYHSVKFYNLILKKSNLTIHHSVNSPHSHR